MTIIRRISNSRQIPANNTVIDACNCLATYLFIGEIRAKTVKTQEDVNLVDAFDRWMKRQEQDRIYAEITDYFEKYGHLQP